MWQWIQEKDWRTVNILMNKKRRYHVPLLDILCSPLEHRGNLEGEGDNIADEEIIPVDEGSS